MATINLDSYQKRAQALYGAYKNAVETAERDTSWSAQGRQDVIGKARAFYRQAMDALLSEANTAVERAREANTAARGVALAKEAARRRGVLGDAVYADLVRRRVERMRSDEIMQAIDGATNEFECELLRAYGELEVTKRMAGNGHTVYDSQAHKAMQAQAATLTAEFDATDEALQWQLPEAVRKLDQLADDQKRAEFAEQIRREF